VNDQWLIERCVLQFLWPTNDVTGNLVEPFAYSGKTPPAAG
jgi:hypothetical protein